MFIRKYGGDLRRPTTIGEGQALIEWAQQKLREQDPGSLGNSILREYIDSIRTSIAKANTAAAKQYGKLVGYHPDVPVSNQPPRTVRQILGL
jgi:hypothetical protein